MNASSSPARWRKRSSGWRRCQTAPQIRWNEPRSRACADLYTTLDQSSRATAVGLDCLRHLGIDLSAHPTDEETRREYERIWSQLGSRMIEDLIELPLMSDPASLATMDVLTKIGPPSLHTDAQLFALVICRAVNLSLKSATLTARAYLIRSRAATHLTKQPDHVHDRVSRR